MTKKKLAERIAKSVGITIEQATRILSELLQEIENALHTGQKVTIAGFGTFYVVRRKERKGTNPRTGLKIKIPTRRTLKFNPGKRLKDAVNLDFNFSQRRGDEKGRS
ncbi:MAG: HU family DNA-binding protein [Candidatus Aminicenantia bacterium]